MIQILPCTGGSFTEISCANEGKQKRGNKEPIPSKITESDDQASMGHFPLSDVKPGDESRL
jgi:hypothetical protein